VLGREDLALENIAPAKRPERLPTVFDRGEIERLLARLEGTPKLVAALLYGAGLRLLEGLRLRIRDIELWRTVTTSEPSRSCSATRMSARP